MSNQLIFILGGTIGFLGVFALILAWQILVLRKKMRSILGSGGAKTLEESLKWHKSQIEDICEQIRGISADVNDLRKMAEPSIQKVGMVRFNPFENVGGDNSFAIAFLDSKNDGIILTGLYMREGVRVYSKPIAGGKTEYQLSDEEKQALEKATRGQA